MNFSFQLIEKTFCPNRVHVPKDVESGVQREEFFRNPTADKAAASTLPSGLFVAFEVGARGTDKTLQGRPMEPAHKRVPVRAREEHVPKVVRPCRANQGKASVQDVTLSQSGYGTCSLSRVMAASDCKVLPGSAARGNVTFNSTCCSTSRSRIPITNTKPCVFR